ncbi:MAG: ABC transporter ATP-binding protein [Kiloniellales bacterium]|nr:ABC transporter ATP-binding protein [Kiloniellales bacterium]
MAGLTLDRVTKVYETRRRGGVLAVDAVDMAVEDGEIVGLLGSSGCGKTSTLRMVAGFETVTEGEIRIGGRRINDLPPAKRNVAMAFEGYALYPPLRIRDNIAFGLLRDRRPKAEVAARVAEVAALLEIGDLLERYPPSLSGGEQQRVSLARALARSADLHLLDEPMSQLEPQLRAILRARIKDWLISHKMTTVFVTHDQTEAIALADRIAVMEAGVLQQFAAPAELKERPANLFVAGFIGEPPMNLFKASVDRSGAQPLLVVEDAAGRRAFDLPLPDLPLADGQRLYLGIRPHRIGFGGGGISARVLSNHWLGDQTHLGLEVGGLALTGVADGAVEARPGGEIAVELPAASLHVFEPESGRAIAHGARLAGADRGAAA